MKRLVSGLGVAILLLVTAACSSPATAPSAAPGLPDPDALQISAKDLRFSTAQLSAPADKPFSIVFENQDGAPHNVSIYKDEALSQKVFGQDPFGGPASQTYAIPALAAGSYVFVCDVHRDMRGTLSVQ
jgi:plastocyanin